MFERTTNDQDSGYNQRSIVGIIISSFGWNGGIDGITKNPKEAANLRRIMWHKDAEDRHEYRQQVVYTLSGYVVLRLDKLDRQRKSTEEIVEWLRRMAEFTNTEHYQ